MRYAQPGDTLWRLIWTLGFLVCRTEPHWNLPVSSQCHQLRLVL